MLEIDVFKKYCKVILILQAVRMLKVLKRYKMKDTNIFFNNELDKSWIGDEQI